MELTRLTICEVSELLRTGDVLAEAYSQALLERAAQLENLNAFISLEPELVKAAARKADDFRQSNPGDSRVLLGIPLVLKDNIDTSTLPTTGGTPTLRGHRPPRNAPVAQALIDAGAIVLGKTNMHELAYGITNNNTAFGAARNPYNPDMIPGGSSGGTAVAVGARMAPAGLGTDTGGSVRIPAALCGIVGFRPTTGSYSREGIIPISSTRDTAGPMARSVADCVLLDGLIRGNTTSLQPASLNGLRLGIARVPYFENLDSAIEKPLANALTMLKDYGAELVEFDAPDIAEHDQAAGFPIAFFETVVELHAYLRNSGARPDFRELCEGTASPDVNAVLMSLQENAVTEEVYREALLTHRPALQTAIAGYFERYRLSALVMPTTPLPARPIGEDQTVDLNGARVPTFPTYICNTDPGSVAGLPGLSLPIGITDDGLPIGLEIDGAAGADRDLLAIGLACEGVFDPMPEPEISIRHLPK